MGSRIVNSKLREGGTAPTSAKSASNESNVAAVVKLVKEDPRINIYSVSERLSLSF